MFYTGMQNSGPNAVPAELDVLAPLFRLQDGGVIYDRDSGQTTLQNQMQLPFMMLPFTMNDRIFKVHSIRKNTEETFNLTSTLLDFTPSDRKYLLFATIPAEDMPTFEAELTKGDAAPELMRKALALDPKDPLPILRTTEAAAVLIAKEIMPLTLLTFVALLPHIWPELLQDCRYPVDSRIFHALGSRKYDLWSRMLLDWGTPIIETEEKERHARTIKDFFANVKTSATTQFNSRLQSINNDIQSYETALKSRIRDYTETLALMQHYILHGNDFSETIDYWLKKKEIKEFQKYSEESALLRIVTPIINYDEDDLRAMLESNVTNSMNGSTSRKQFMRRIFIDRTHVLHFMAGIQMDFVSNEANYYDMPSDNSCHAMKNPHLKHFNCWGTATPLITMAMREQRYETVIEQVIATVGNLNFADTPVMDNFWNDISSGYARNIPCIQSIATKSWYTPRQFLTQTEGDTP